MTANCTNMKTKLSRVFTCLIILIAITASQISVAFAAGQRFTDVEPGFWAYSFIEQAAEKGYVSGTSSTTFTPNQPVTNAEWMTMITRAFYTKSVEAAAQYNEGGAWWRPYAETAYIKGILKGTTVLGPRDSEAAEWDSTITADINRYDMAQVRYNVMTTETTKTPDAAAIAAAQQKIGDWASVPANYQQAVAACYAAGLLSGTDSNGTFGGTSVMTRAQAAVVLCRIAE